MISNLENLKSESVQVHFSVFVSSWRICSFWRV